MLSTFGTKEAYIVYGVNNESAVRKDLDMRKAK